MEQPILKVDNLTKIFTRKGQPDFAAVDHISFDLMPGECLGLIGESGSGKSTTINMITRLLDPTEGKIVLDGDDITPAAPWATGSARACAITAGAARKQRQRSQDFWSSAV